MEYDLRKIATVSSWGWTKTGNVRAENQDSFLNWPERFLWAVADGVGQGADGELASRLVAEKLSGLKRAASLDEQSWAASELMDQANAELWARRENGQPCASTVALLLFHNERAACLWAGDSRAYLWRGGVLYQCTRDHSLRQEYLDQGLLSAGEVERVAPKNIITRAVGAGANLELERVDFSLAPGDRLLLCTDGFYNLFSTEEIGGVLKRAPGPAEASVRFEELAAIRRQSDNLTQITVFISELQSDSL